MNDAKKGIDFIGVNCVFFCHDGAGKLLMHKRSVNCRDEHGKWDCGGGSMEHGETFEDTIRRELMEEYCCEPLEIQYVVSKNVLRDNSGVQTHWIANLHVVKVDPAQVQIGEPDKMEDIGWFAVDELPEDMHSMLIPHLNEVKHLL